MYHIIINNMSKAEFTIETFVDNIEYYKNTDLYTYDTVEKLYDEHIKTVIAFKYKFREDMDYCRKLDNYIVELGNVVNKYEIQFLENGVDLEEEFKKYGVEMISQEEHYYQTKLKFFTSSNGEDWKQMMLENVHTKYIEYKDNYFKMTRNGPSTIFYILINDLIYHPDFKDNYNKNILENVNCIFQKSDRTEKTLKNILCDLLIENKQIDHIDKSDKSDQSDQIAETKNNKFKELQELGKQIKKEIPELYCGPVMCTIASKLMKEYKNAENVLKKVVSDKDSIKKLFNECLEEQKNKRMEKNKNNVSNPDEKKSKNSKVLSKASKESNESKKSNESKESKASKESNVSKASKESDEGMIKKKKTPIPKKIKQLVWNKYVGEEKGTSLCKCCNVTTISQMDFACGHIISENDGGTITVENLLPICSLCNTSMNSKNMNDFIEKHGLNKQIEMIDDSDVKLKKTKVLCK